MFFQVGRENSDKNAAKTVKMSVVNAYISCVFLVETHDNEFINVDYLLFFKI